MSTLEKSTPKRSPSRMLSLMLPCLFCCLLWGIGVPLQKYSYEVFALPDSDIWNKLLICGVRFLVAGGAILLTHAIKRIPLRSEEGTLKGIVGLATTQVFFQMLFVSIGITYCSGVHSSVLIASQTFVAVIISHFLFADERLNRNRVIGCLLGFAGVVILVLGDSGGESTLFGQALVFLAAVFAAMGAIFSKTTCTGTRDVSRIVAWQAIIGGSALFLISIAMHASLTWTPMGVLVCLALAFTSGAASSVWMSLFRRFPVSDILVYLFTVPLFGALFSAILLGESIFSVRNLVSLAAICVGITVVNLRSTDKPM